VLTLLFTAYLLRFSGLKVSSDNRKSGIHVAWTTITYRSVALMILAVAAIFFIAMRVAFPQFTQNTVQAGENVANKLLERVGMAPAAVRGFDGAAGALHRARRHGAGEERQRQQLGDGRLQHSPRKRRRSADRLGRHGEGCLQRRHQLHREAGFADRDRRELRQRPAADQRCGCGQHGNRRSLDRDLQPGFEVAGDCGRCDGFAGSGVGGPGAQRS
jgi:hypothetical protein